jgi:hypothetical protein
MQTKPIDSYSHAPTLVETPRMSVPSMPRSPLPPLHPPPNSGYRAVNHPFYTGKCSQKITDLLLIKSYIAHLRPRRPRASLH